MKKFNFFIYILILIVIFSSKTLFANPLEHKIVVIVNDKIITSFDIIQRIKINSIINNIKLNEGNMDIVRNSVINELIDEKIKIEKSKEYNIKVDEKEYLEFENNILNQKGIIKDNLNTVFIENNIDYDEFSNFIKTQITWQKVIGGLYYRLVSASEIEINEVLKNNPYISNDQAKQIVIQKQLDLKSNKLLRDLKNEATIEYRK
tara:strand:+ start:124 stop:738 length:615 start_codon:yes stop_codon:yes gene_type:complete